MTEIESGVGRGEKCPVCGDTGLVVEVEAVCCGRATVDGDCCGEPIPEPYQVLCPESCRASEWLAQANATQTEPKAKSLNRKAGQ